MPTPGQPSKQAPPGAPCGQRQPHPNGRGHGKGRYGSGHQPKGQRQQQAKIHHQPQGIPRGHSGADEHAIQKHQAAVGICAAAFGKRHGLFLCRRRFAVQGGFGGEVPPRVAVALTGAVAAPLPCHRTGGQRFTDQQPVQLGAQLPVYLLQRVTFPVLAHIIVAAQHAAVAFLRAVGVGVGLGVTAQAGTLGQHAQALRRLRRITLRLKQPQVVPQHHTLQPQVPHTAFIGPQGQPLLGPGAAAQHAAAA